MLNQKPIQNVFRNAQINTKHNLSIIQKILNIYQYRYQCDSVNEIYF